MGARRIVLIGLSGTGKTTVASRLARRLGWTAVDSDSEIERSVGLTVPEIFDRLGESSFRQAESAAMAAALRRDKVVIATGGGAVLNPSLWSDDGFGHPDTLVVALDARPETSLRRLRAQQAAEGEGAARPLVAGADPLARIAAMKRQRQPVYDQADLTLVVDAVTPEEVAAEVARLSGVEDDSPDPDVRLHTGDAVSSIFIGSGVQRRVGELARQRWPRAQRVWLVSDEVVAPLYRDPLRSGLGAAGYTVQWFEVPAGEESKRLEVAGRLYDWLLEGGVERGDVLVALGGGVIGDLTGFVAATTLRGVGLIQMPTSLLAMVDSSVGGKTGINHAAGKNLIGAFYQPPLVLIDPSFLATLPARQLTAGWAEVIKHAVIQPSTPGGDRADLLPFLERNAAGLQRLAEPATSYLIRRNVALKAAVVAADEREAGQRAFLNFGHTIGHAIEAAGYRYLHGEAVAVGLRAAMRLGAAIGTCKSEHVARLDQLLDHFGLPRRADVAEADVLALLGRDKKRRDGKQRWVLPTGNAGVDLVDDVPRDLVRDAVAEVLGEGDNS